MEEIVEGEGRDGLEAVEGLAEVRHLARVDGGAHRVDGGRDVSLVVVGGGRGGAGVAGDASPPDGASQGARGEGEAARSVGAASSRGDASPFVATEARSPDEPARLPREPLESLRACATARDADDSTPLNIARARSAIDVIVDASADARDRRDSRWRAGARCARASWLDEKSPAEVVDIVISLPADDEATVVRANSMPTPRRRVPTPHHNHNGAPSLDEAKGWFRAFAEALGSDAIARVAAT